MYNLRYHIASLVAVFLALALGLLLGAIVVQTGILKAAQSTMVDRYTRDYDRMKADRDRLRTQTDALGSFAGEVWQPLVRGLLTGQTIFVIADSSSSEAAKSAADAVAAAGGSPVVVTLASPTLGLTDPKITGALSQAAGATMDGQGVVSALAREWSSTDTTRPVTGALLASGAMRMEGLTETTTVSGAVVAAFAGPEPDATAIGVGRVLQATRHPVVAVEVTDKRFGMTKVSNEAGISSVDDVESPLGRLAMIWVLAGRAEGHFGTAVDAEAAYPTPLFPAK